MSKPYPRDLRDGAVRLVCETRDQCSSGNQATVSTAAKLGIATAQTLRNWVRQAEVDAGARPGITTPEAARIKAPKWDVAELRRANDILKAAASFFAAESWDRTRGGSLRLVRE